MLFFASYFILASSLEVTVPNENELVPVSAYEGNSSISKATISEGVRIISTQAFRSCTILETVLFPPTLTHIKQKAFENCYKLKELNFNEGLISIDNYAFMGCSGLLSIAFPSSLQTIGKSVFTSCNSLKVDTITFNPKMNYYYENGIMYSKDKKTMEFAFTFVDKLSILDSVESLQSEAIVNCHFLTEVTIPDKVKVLANFKSIGDCNLLTKLNFGKNLQIVDSASLVSLSKLKTINLEESNPFLTVHNNILFTKDLKELIFFPLGLTNTIYQIPKNTSKIGLMTFSNNRLLVDFTVESGNPYMKSINGVIYSVDEKILIKCPPMKALTSFPENVEIIADAAFYGCQKLTGLSFNSNPNTKLVEIQSKAFTTAVLSNTVVMPSTIRILRISSFSYTNIESFKFVNGGSLTFIEQSIFLGCKNLKSFVFPDSKSIDSIPYNTFSLCPSLVSISIADNIKYIAGNAFSGAFALESVVFPSNLIEIGNSAFESCIGLKTVLIPFNTKVVRNSAFLSCTNINTATLLSCNTIVEKDAFLGCNKLDKYVCKATKSFTVAVERNSFLRLNSIMRPFFFVMMMLE